MTILALLVPSVHIAYRSVPLHATLETSVAMIALLAAYLAVGRFLHTRRLADLLLSTALGILAVANLLFSAVPWSLLNASSARLSGWMALLTSLAGAGLLAASAFAPERTARHPGRWLATALVLAGVAIVAVTVVVAVFGLQLPLGADPAVWPGAVVDFANGPRSLVIAGLVSAGLFGLAAVGFTRRAERERDELVSWLAASAVFAAFARLNYVLLPSLYPQWVYIGDILRLGSFLLILIGCAREIRFYQREVARTATLEERRRIARDLHDGLTQELAFIVAQTRALRHAAFGAGIEVDDLMSAAERALAESRRAIAALSDHEDRLDVALERMVDDLTRRAGARARVVVQSGTEVDSTTREALFRIVHEAVTNASCHGHADNVSVEVRNGDGLRLSVTDDGGGFDAAAIQRGAAFGLFAMRERAEALGGELHVSSAPGDTRIEVVLPSRPAQRS